MAVVLPIAGQGGILHPRPLISPTLARFRFPLEPVRAGTVKLGHHSERCARLAVGQAAHRSKFLPQPDRVSGGAGFGLVAGASREHSGSDTKRQKRETPSRFLSTGLQVNVRGLGKESSRTWPPPQACLFKQMPHPAWGKDPLAPVTK
jgi:hypothetical protein